MARCTPTPGADNRPDRDLSRIRTPAQIRRPILARTHLALALALDPDPDPDLDLDLDRTRPDLAPDLAPDLDPDRTRPGHLPDRGRGPDHIRHRLHRLHHLHRPRIGVGVAVGMTR
ncbi:hypothetical protein THI4931_08420 [Pandoraea sputorum]|nr:hypothetical protein THI4931_08420 [Pandoraea sputorum]